LVIVPTAVNEPLVIDGTAIDAATSDADTIGSAAAGLAPTPIKPPTTALAAASAKKRLRNPIWATPPCA
jgi:hypothetical protein